jgi:hypothetical protein
VPTDFKKAIISPVFKKGDPKLPSNYRPISNLTVISKCFESALYKQLTKHFDGFLPNDMFGFRKGKNCEKALITLTEYCRESIDKGDMILVIGLDLSRAFDCVCHPLLLSKLKALGVDAASVELLSSYLCNRTQAVRVKSSLSQECQLTTGVPQGSILGPLLFNLYVSDLSWSCDANLIRYADDTNIIVRADTFEDLRKLGERQLKEVTTWFEANGFVTNLTKTQLLLICGSSRKKRTQREDFSITSGDTLIHPSESIKLLGVTIDQELNLKRNTKEVVKKITYATKLSMLVSKFIDAQTRISLFQTYILSHADFCGVVSLCSMNTQHNSIETALSRSCRRLKIRKENSEEAINDLKLRWIIRALCVFYEIIHSKSSSALFSIVFIISSSRSCMPVRLPKIKTSLMEKSLFLQCSKCWNRLPKAMDNSKTSGSLTHFKRELCTNSDVIFKTWNSV